MSTGERPRGSTSAFSLAARRLRDALADEFWFEALFERLNLQSDAAVEVGDRVAEVLVCCSGLLAGRLVVRAELAGELVGAHGSEDALGEEVLNEWEEGVFAG